MGRLSHRGGATVSLSAATRVGRHPASDLHLDPPGGRVSREHALVRWNGDGWTVRDLGSTNGTFVDGSAVSPGVDVPLGRGTGLGFGDPAPEWTLDDDAPPRPLAEADDGRQALGGQDVLLVPEGETPEVVIYRDGGGGWMARRGEEALPVRSGAVLTADGTRWRLVLPDVWPATTRPTAVDPWTLQLRADVDAERVAAALVAPGARLDLGTRAHLRVLLPLAKERLRAERRGLPFHEAGWVQPDDLVAHLHLHPSTFWVHLHRLRQQLGTLGFAEGVPVLERRFTGELRVGVERVELLPG